MPPAPRSVPLEGSCHHHRRVVVVADNEGDLADLLGADGAQASLHPDLDGITPAVSYAAAASALDGVRAALSRATTQTTSRLGLVAEVNHIVRAVGSAQVLWARGLEEHGLAGALRLERRPSHRRHLQRAAAAAQHRRDVISVVVDAESVLGEHYYILRQQAYARGRPRAVPASLDHLDHDQHDHDAQTPPHAAETESDSLLSSDAETICGCGTCTACAGVEETEQHRDRKRARISFAASAK